MPNGSSFFRIVKKGKHKVFKASLYDINKAIEAKNCKERPLEEIVPEHISKKHFRPGGMAPSEWTRSVRAVRDTPVADYPAPGANTTRRVAYRPPIAVSPFLLALSVSYCK